jgi:hypothetical protein
VTALKGVSARVFESISFQTISSSATGGVLMADLSLRVDKPDNVYRYIEEWEAVPAATGHDIHYLFLYGVFQWDANRGTPVRAFSVVMQYSATLGREVDLTTPAHILEVDAERVWTAFDAFRKRCQDASRGRPN